MDYDLIIIGGGPAGITAGIYAARKKIKTLLLTKDFVGQIGKANRVENYPGLFGASGLEIMGKFQAQLKEFEIETREEDVAKIEKTKEGFLVRTTKAEDFEAKAVILATGRDPRPLEIPGEKEKIGKGISYCEICDAPFFKNKNVAVMGGGNSGFQAATELAKVANKIYLLEFSSKVPADELNQQRAGDTGKIEVILNTEAKQILGNNWVEGLVCRERTTKAERTLEVDGIFVMIGYVPATGFVKGLVGFNKRDEIIIDPKTCATKTPGLFAAGDVTDIPYKQIIIATGEGAKAVLSAYEYLQKLKDKDN